MALKSSLSSASAERAAGLAGAGCDTPIPFNRPWLTGRELAYLHAVLVGRHLCGDGPFTKRCSALLEQIVGTRRAFLTTSCTHALELAALLLDLAPGDEVIVPSFTFVSTANAFVLRGARPVFCDIRSDTLNLDEKCLAGLFSPRTRAIVPVHYAGVACEMDAILANAARYGLAVVEDNAHGLFGRYKDRLLGTFGALATQSFHETKNVVCGEGGALLVNDERLIARAEILREKGTNRSRFFRGEVDKYTWVDLGSSFLPSELLAACLYAQLEEWERIQRRRREIWSYYFESLRDWAAPRGVQLPVVPPHCAPAFHMFHVVLPSPDDRQRLIAHLKARQIHAVFHYVPLHLSPAGRRFGTAPQGCPVAERVSECLLRLPFFNELTRPDQERVIDAVRAFPL